MTMNPGSYSFLAITGKQGDFSYFLIQYPLRLVPRLLLFDEPEVPEPLRKVRSLDTGLVAAMINYLIAQPDHYVLAPLIATVNLPVSFEPITAAHPDLGLLTVPLNAQLLIQEGQHQRAAIQKFLAQAPAHGNETIPVMLFPDPDFARSSQIYTNLQRLAIHGTQSKRILHEQSDLAAFVRQLIEEVPLFQERIELEKTTISNRSTALFTLSAVYQATQALLNMRKQDLISSDQALIGREFWYQLGAIIPAWAQVIRREVTPSHLREHYIHAHTVTLVAIGLAGQALIQTHPDDWQVRLQTMGSIDWSRTNTQLWEGRALVRGRMSKARDSVSLTAVAIKRLLGLTISAQERELETTLLGL
jgi:DNA sulfur modification protein DndB